MSKQITVFILKENTIRKRDFMLVGATSFKHFPGDFHAVRITESNGFVMQMQNHEYILIAFIIISRLDNRKMFLRDPQSLRKLFLSQPSQLAKFLNILPEKHLNIFILVTHKKIISQQSFF